MELSWYNFGRRAVVVTTEGLMDILTHVNMDDVRMGDVISWDGEAPEPFMLIIPKCKGESGEREVQECLVAFDNSEPATEAMIVGNDKTTRVVKLDPTCNKRIHISLWGDKAEGYAFFYFKEEKTVGSTIEMSRGDVDEKDCGYLLKTARFVMAVLAYMKACPEKVVKGVRFLDDDNHMSFSFSKLTEPDRVDTSVDGRGEGSHKAPHFRKWHLRRYPVRKDGTRREGLLLIHGCAVGFGSVSAVEN
jgi:hypothetical protein